jgi:antitoxin component YwqK of YwqJK toxin-antitoxin module
MAGNLLDGEFVKMYHSNQLAEQGKFEDGLKVGLWKTWYTNGVIETTQYWKDGYRSGDYYHYDSTGEMLEKGNYRANLKHGKWLDFVKKDTIAYRKGSVYVKKKTSRKKIKADLPNTKKSPDATINNNEKKQDNFFKRLFSRKGAN